MKDKTHAMREQQKNQVIARSNMIHRILKQMTDHGHKPKNMTEITRYVAERYTSITGEAMSDSTLRRNDYYKAQIAKFMEDNNYDEAKSKQILLNDKTHLQMQVSDLMDENVLLKKRLSKALSDLSAYQGHAIEDKSATIVVAEVNQELTNAARILHMLCREFSLTIDIDVCEVIDPVSGKSVITENEFPYFFEYIKAL